MAKNFAVIGSPITHSKSPAIHSAAFGLLALSWSYGRQEVQVIELEAFLRETALDGLSVTMPLKEEAYRLAVTSSDEAQRAGAVNTLLRSDSGWIGFNTDVFGLQMALANNAASSALILGSGATARNAVLAISGLNPGVRLFIKARSEQKAKSLIAWAESLGIAVGHVDQVARLGEFELVVSTLPPLSSAEDWFSGDPSGTLLDVAYSPWPSELATKWLSAGGNVISGLEMLIWQAIAQLRIFSSGSVAESFANEVELASAMRQAALSER